MSGNIAVDPNDVDKPVDEQIGLCLSTEKPTSFFLFAGAGSGKTSSLIKALTRIRQSSGTRLRMRGQRVGVITYTNAACDEIKQRLDFDPLIEVSTIHSFVWSLIEGFDSDIKEWLRVALTDELVRLKEKASRAGTKAETDRLKSIDSKQRRLDALSAIKRFTYNPSGDNRGRDSLNHTEVIEIGADFLIRKPLMRSILVDKFPILLVDESQDTNKLLMESFLDVQAKEKARFCLGLFGDTMQRIYSDGKHDLGKNLPADWQTPAKKMNHRCSPRIVDLINKIRSAVDDQVQTPRTGKEPGYARLYIASSDCTDKLKCEREAAEDMAKVTGDTSWSGDKSGVKRLILEHHMAARRLGFQDMFQPLYEVDSLKTGLLDGSLPGLRFFSELILPLIRAKRNNDPFTAAAIIRKYSPILGKEGLKRGSEKQPLQLKKAQAAYDKLVALWADGGAPSFSTVLLCVSETGLFEIPESLRLATTIVKTENIESKEVGEITPAGDAARDPVLEAWDKFLPTPFSQIEPYTAYIKDEAEFDTHQGVKGREFPRVLVVMDDTEARGFLFSYEKLFGVKAKTKTDIENEREGKDTGIDRTRRLFYVTCSRAESSLALVAYSSAPDKLREYAIAEGWFKDTEIKMLS